MKKIISVFLIFGSFLSAAEVFANPIIELAAPRVQTPRIVPEEAVKSIQKPNVDVPKVSKPKKNSVVKKIPRVRKKITRINYHKISKLIEYGYYDEADKILQSAINRNANDIKAQALLTLSLAKQFKLDPAQKKLDVLLGKYPNNSNLHYAQGVVYYQRTTSSNMFYRNNSKKFIVDAKQEFKKAIELDKKNEAALNAAGVVSMKLNNPKEARNYFQKAFIADKSYSIAIDNLGTLDFLDGKINEAEKKFKQALSYNTQNTTAMYHLAQVAFKKNDYAQALFFLNNALAINPNLPAIYNLMGKAYMEQGNEAAAINSFKKSIEVKPEFVLSYIDLAEIYEKRGDFDFAIERLKTAVAIEPDFYDADLKIADISLIKGNYKQAIDFYAKIVGIDGYNPQALKGLADSYYALAQKSSNKSPSVSKKDLIQVLEYVNKTIETNGDDLELHLAKLKLNEMANQSELPKMILNQIIQTPATTLIDVISIGEAYLALYNYVQAQKAFDTAINLSQNINEDSYLAEIFLYHKQYKSAKQILQKILKEDAQNQMALNNLDYIQKCEKYADNYFQAGKSFSEKKNPAAAIDYLSRSVSLNPNNSQAYIILAQIYEKQKKNEEALKNYKTYLGMESNSSEAKKIEHRIKSLEVKL
jgi:tetratricopeptide (TPR) repeat protein